MYQVQESAKLLEILQDFDTLEQQNSAERLEWAKSIAKHPLDKVSERMYHAFQNLLN